MWRSKQQKSVSLSSAEAEYVAVSESVKEVVFVVMILKSLGIKVKSPVTIKVDNMGAIYMTENSTTNSRTRHVDTRYHYVREKVEDGEIEIVFVKSLENIADGFTKNVKGDIHGDHIQRMVWDRSEIADVCLSLSPQQEGCYKAHTGDVLASLDGRAFGASVGP